MKRKWPMAVALAVAGVGLAWLVWRPGSVDAPDGTRPAGAISASSRSAASSIESRETMRRPGANGAARTPAAAPPTLFGEYLKSKDKRALYDRLEGSPEGQTAEGRFVRYQLLRDCAKVSDDKSYRFTGWRPGPATREEFVNGIAMTDPNRDRRIAAYDAFQVDRCGTLSDVNIAYPDLMALLQGAAAAGDPRARAVSVEQQLWESRRANGGSWIRDGGVTVTDAQFDALRQAASTRDPEAIRVTGRVLSNSWSDYALRIGPEQEPVDPRPFVNAWLVLACEYGAPCGTDSPRMLQACALQGHCDAMNFPDYVYYYGSTPYDSQLLTQYRQILRQGIETGNWNQLTVVRGQPPGGNRITFVPGPR